MPCGLIRSTTRSMTKPYTCEYELDTTTLRTDSEMPSTNAAITAPFREPNPPMITTTNACSTGNCPTVG